MIAITVSTNYQDLIPIILESNERHFKHWYWITDQNDQETIDAIPKTSNHTILYWDFNNNNRPFDKGGAVRMAQELAYKEYPDEWYLLIDSDIALYPDFSVNTDELDITKIHGAGYRYCFYSKENFDNDQIDFDHGKQHVPWGYFQLYKAHNLYVNTYDASQCDDRFLQLYGDTHEIRMQNFVILENVKCRHLGKNNTHWQGKRVPGIDFKQ